MQAISTQILFLSESNILPRPRGAARLAQRLLQQQPRVQVPRWWLSSHHHVRFTASSLVHLFLEVVLYEVPGNCFTAVSHLWFTHNWKTRYLFSICSVTCDHLQEMFEKMLKECRMFGLKKKKKKRRDNRQKKHLPE